MTIAVIWRPTRAAAAWPGPARPPQPRPARPDPPWPGPAGPDPARPHPAWPFLASRTCPPTNQPPPALSDRLFPKQPAGVCCGPSERGDGGDSASFGVCPWLPRTRQLRGTWRGLPSLPLSADSARPELQLGGGYALFRRGFCGGCNCRGRTARKLAAPDREQTGARPVNIEPRVTNDAQPPGARAAELRF